MDKLAALRQAGLAPLTAPLALYDMGRVIRAAPHATRCRVSTAFFNTEDVITQRWAGLSRWSARP